MESSLLSSLSSYPILGLVATIIMIMIVISIVKSLFRLASILVMVGLVLVLFFGFSPKEVMDKGANLAGSGSELIDGNVIQLLFNAIQTEDFFIKKVGEDTVIEIESLGINYNVSDLLNQLGEANQQDLNQIIEEEKGD
ncbi:hypothetical protein NC797_13900 [Aquibacillus sp. 3ASR75-11]|uniref:Uncharacterized protein n=1 Tax=Terrihalobacillus insolitus TaxID=2950438 RepID=A0A9X3WWS2_9BACI|nr:hypothetical protein [Terrihalobacillus insolitus]MDC3413737.1 hypothetical protein [Terrihalobacillus insolitus]MDC3425596.1 hypothetical protein [Terrihalobacillus insolitus]